MKICRLCVTRFIYGASVEPSPLLLQKFIGLFYQPWMVDDDCGGISEANEWQMKRKYWDNIYPSPLCPPQIPHDFTRARTQATAVGRRRLTPEVRHVLYVTLVTNQVSCIRKRNSWYMVCIPISITFWKVHRV
jgi:hypothetical protein